LKEKIRKFAFNNHLDWLSQDGKIAAVVIMQSDWDIHGQE